MRVGSLFAGIGGFDLGFERAGMTTAWQVEIDKHARGVLERHFRHAARHEDVRHIGKSAADCAECACCGEPFCNDHNEHFADCACVGATDDEFFDNPVDVLCGGFPCQDISAGADRWGAKGVNGERSGLWSEFARIIEWFRPRFVVVENTGRLRNGRAGTDLAAVVGELDRLSYMGAGIVLDAAAFGLPARHPRVFLVATDAGDARGLERGARLVGEIRRHDPGCVVLEGPGQSRTTDVRSRPTAGEYRKLTPIECERVLGFPDDWTAGQSDAQRYRQLGNAVAVPCAEWIGRRIGDSAIRKWRTA